MLDSKAKSFKSVLQFKCAENIFQILGIKCSKKKKKKINVDFNTLKSRINQIWNSKIIYKSIKFSICSLQVNGNSEFNFNTFFNTLLGRDCGGQLGRLTEGQSI